MGKVAAVGGAILGAALLLSVLALLLLGPDSQPGGARGRGLMNVLLTGRKASIPSGSARLRRPLWDGVLPENILDQQLPLVRNPHYGMHVIALGKNGSLFHKFQTGPTNFSDPMLATPMSPWHCLTPNASLIFGNNPAIALNADGRIELFVGYKPDSMDVWQMYQTDAKDPLAWSAPRAPFCAVPSAAYCTNCSARPECRDQYWSNGFVWTTSNQALWLDPEDQKLKLTWRTFDGHMYQLSQGEPSNSKFWSSENMIQFAIFE